MPTLRPALTPMNSKPRCPWGLEELTTAGRSMLIGLKQAQVVEIRSGSCESIHEDPAAAGFRKMVLNEAKLAWRTPVGLIAQRKRHVAKPEAPATSKQLNELWAPPTVGENVATFQVAVVPPQPTCNAYGSDTGRVYHQSEVEPFPSPCHGAKPDPLAVWTQTPSTELPDTHEIWPLTLRLVTTAAFRGATGADCGAAAAERGAAGTPAATFAPGWVNGMLTGELFGPAAAPPTVTPGRDEADGTVFWLAAGVAERSRVPVPSAAAWAVFAAALGLCDTAAPTPTAPPAKITTATATAIT